MAYMTLVKTHVTYYKGVYNAIYSGVSTPSPGGFLKKISAAVAWWGDVSGSCP